MWVVFLQRKLSQPSLRKTWRFSEGFQSSLCVALSSLELCPAHFTNPSLSQLLNNSQFQEVPRLCLSSLSLQVIAWKLSPGSKSGQSEDLPHLFPLWPISLSFATSYPMTEKHCFIYILWLCHYFSCNSKSNPLS